MTLQFESKLRVRYAEVDRSGFVYNGNYAQYYEVARSSAMRDLGFTYKKMEEDYGIIMPLREQYSRFIKPAHYDDELRILTQINELPKARIRFDYRIYRNDELIHEGYSELVFLNGKSMRPQRAPQWFLDLLIVYGK